MLNCLVQGKKKCWASSLLIQRQSDESAMFLVKRSMFSVLQLVRRSVYNYVLVVYQCISCLGLFWYFFNWCLKEFIESQDFTSSDKLFHPRFAVARKE